MGYGIWGRQASDTIERLPLWTPFGYNIITPISALSSHGFLPCVSVTSLLFIRIQIIGYGNYLTSRMIS